MGKLEYRRGDLFEVLKREVLSIPVRSASAGPAPPGVQVPPFVMIPHVVNDVGLWGAGFVVELSKFDDSAETSYRDSGDMKLGSVDDVYEKAYDEDRSTSDARYCVLNMCAQHGVGGEKPLRYAALGRCMYTVDDLGLHSRQKKNLQIWCPKFGSGLAGGNWLLIEEMIQETWVEQFGLNVVVFTR